MKHVLFILVALLAATLLLVGCNGSPTDPGPGNWVEIKASEIVVGPTMISVPFSADGPCWVEGVWADVSCRHVPGDTGDSVTVELPPGASVAEFQRRASLWGVCTIIIAPAMSWQRAHPGVPPLGCEARQTLTIPGEGSG